MLPLADVGNTKGNEPPVIGCREGSGFKGASLFQPPLENAIDFTGLKHSVATFRTFPKKENRYTFTQVT